METDKNALSYWFPKIEAAGLPVPRTIMVDMPEDAVKSVWEVFDGKKYDGGADSFFREIGSAAEGLGYPAFLRTDHTSGKHEWNQTCFLKDETSIQGCVVGIAEYSEMCGMFGELPWKRWAVRELLPTMPVGRCEDFGGMPICREFRFFVDDGTIRCWHPYWPLDALEQGRAVCDGKFDYEAFCDPGDDLHCIEEIAKAAGEAVGGSWSIDILDTAEGWYLTDMAEAGRSFHWPGCEAQTERCEHET